ncbi:MAG: AAA family ATPase [Candidatus Sumerlaeota bacterium]|nr:AAA family ATPase [Candidatus Sumerlaeota bacterium]
MIYDRWYANTLRTKLDRPFVHLVFGARQTGKSTLLNALLPLDALRVDLSNPTERSRILANPGDFIRMCRALPPREEAHFVFVDEAQAAPAIFDAVQHLYDSDKQRWRFVLCGSSARKLRRTGANLLPGRSFLHRLYPLTLAEHPTNEKAIPHADSPLPFPWTDLTASERLFPAWDIDARLAYGALPGIVAAAESDRADILKAFSTIHLEEEIRREALIKDWGAFARFLQFAAAESGQILNYTGISNETGISLPTVKTHYQLLEDMFVGFRIPSYAHSPRKNILSTPKFLFFDLGVRHAAAGFSPSRDMVMTNPGAYFEQWVGIELWKRLQYLGDGHLFYQRTRDGAEIDYVIERQERLTPIEVKWTERPVPKDARHLRSFLEENPRSAKRGYIICRCPHPLEIEENVLALPWHCL